MAFSAAPRERTVQRVFLMRPVVRLTPTADAGFTLAGYLGDCVPAGQTKMTGPRTCGVTFSRPDRRQHLDSSEHAAPPVHATAERAGSHASPPGPPPGIRPVPPVGPVVPAGGGEPSAEPEQKPVAPPQFPRSSKGTNPDPPRRSTARPTRRSTPLRSRLCSHRSTWRC